MNNLFHIDVYRYSDVIKFVQILEKTSGTLVSIVRYTSAGNDFYNGYSITYFNSEEIDMEVLC